MNQDGTQATPNAWYHEGKWRNLDRHDVEDAAVLRRTLAGMRNGLVPMSEVSLDPGYNTQEANHRAALHDIVEELGREDLWTLFRVGHLLLGTDNDGEGWRRSMGRAE